MTYGFLGCHKTWGSVLLLGLVEGSGIAAYCIERGVV